MCASNPPKRWCDLNNIVIIIMRLIFFTNQLSQLIQFVYCTRSERAFFNNMLFIIKQARCVANLLDCWPLLPAVSRLVYVFVFQQRKKIMPHCRADFVKILRGVDASFFFRYTIWFTESCCPCDICVHPDSIRSDIIFCVHTLCYLIFIFKSNAIVRETSNATRMFSCLIIGFSISKARNKDIHAVLFATVHKTSRLNMHI